MFQIDRFNKRPWVVFDQDLSSQDDNQSKIPSPETAFALIAHSKIIETIGRKLTASQMAEILLSLAPFASMERVDVTSSRFKSMLERHPDQITFLEDGTLIEGSFDFAAFEYVCLYNVPELTPDERREIFEALKNTPLLERVYRLKGPPKIDTAEPLIAFDPNLAKGKITAVILQDSSRIEDTGRVAMPLMVRKTLEETWESIEHGERDQRFVNYFEELDKARALLAEAKVQNVESPRVVFILEEQETGLQYFHLLTESANNPSGELVTELFAFHGVRSSARHPDSFEAFISTLKNGFLAEEKSSENEPQYHAILGPKYYDHTVESRSPSTGDYYAIAFQAARGVQRVKDVWEIEHEGVEEQPTQDPFVAPDAPIFLSINEVPVSHIAEVYIRVAKDQLEEKKKFYQELFEQSFPTIRYRFSTYS